MKSIVSIAVWLVLIKFGMATSRTDKEQCHTPCTMINGTCVSYECYRQATGTKCTLYSTHKAQINKHATTCVPPEQVIGLPEFCKSIVSDITTPEVANILIERTTVRAVDDGAARNVSYLEDQCLSVTALASVASGSFVAGCFVMWLIIAVLRCLRQCKVDKTNDSNDNQYVQAESRQISTISSQGFRVGRQRPTDLQPENSIASVDSGLSSTQVTTPSHVTQDQRRPTGTGRMFSFNTARLPGAMGDNFNVYVPRQEDGVYAPASDCSYRDYQSIQGSVYAPSSEGGNSDYSGQPTHHVLFIRENGEIYQASSESSGNDYTSLKGSSGNPFSIYYPLSDSSGKDYTSLLDEADLATGYCDVEDMIQPDGNDNVKFRVSGFVIPKNKLSMKGRPAPALENVNEYEVLHCTEDPVMTDDYTRPVDDIAETDAGGHGDTLAAGRRLPMDGFHLSELARSDLQRNSLPHQYIAIEPEDNVPPGNSLGSIQSNR